MNLSGRNDFTTGLDPSQWWSGLTIWIRMTWLVARMLRALLAPLPHETFAQDLRRTLTGSIA